MNMTYVVAILFVLGYYAAAALLVRGVRFTTRSLAISGLMMALTVILESIYIPLPTGSTISLLSPVPLMLLALICSRQLAILAGFLCSFLVLILIPVWYPVHWAQFFVEHAIVFSCLGFAGVFGSSSRWRVVCGMLLASVLKIVAHILSGVLFFSENAWDGWGAFLYSLLYNISSAVPLCLLSGLVVLALPLKVLRRWVGADKPL